MRPRLSYRHILPAQDAGKGYQRPPEAYLWALDWPWFNLSSTELVYVLGWYPVGFIRNGERFELAMPAAGEPGRSVLVSPRDGHWQGSYVPFAVRAYPFLAQPLNAEGGQMTLLLAEQAEAQFTTAASEPLLDTSGQPTAVCLDWIQQFQWHAAVRARDAQVLARLAALELLVPWELNLGTNAAPSPMPQWYRIDEPRLHQISPAVAAELHALGGWGLIYGHLFSRVRANIPALLAERLQPQYDPLGDELRRELFGASADELVLHFDFDQDKGEP